MHLRNLVFSHKNSLLGKTWFLKCTVETVVSVALYFLTQDLYMSILFITVWSLEYMVEFLIIAVVMMPYIQSECMFESFNKQSTLMCTSVK